MKTHVKALVVGGGAVGTGIAYHLAKAGWDTMLVERDELTAGSTWHAAGLLPLFNMSYATTHIHKYSVDFYKGLEAETGLNPGFYVVGNLRMAQTQARMDEYMLYSSVAETAGVYHEFLTPKEIKDRWPLVRTEDLIGALYHPQDGYINPADVTQAMAKARGNWAPPSSARSRSTATAGPGRNGSSPAQGWKTRAACSSPPRTVSTSPPNMSSPPPATTPSALRASLASRPRRSRWNTSIS